MSSVPPHGSSGAPNFPHSGPLPPRRTSYASVAAGASGSTQPTASGNLPTASNQPTYSQLHSEHHTQIPRRIQAEPDMSGEGDTRIPEQWGSGARESSSDLRTSALPKVGGGGWDAMHSGWSSDGFFKPTYLRGSKYMEDLEKAYKESLTAKEEQPVGRSGNGPLSKSSSSANLPKMQPSHRGMAYEIIEHQPPPINAGPGHLPSRWAHADKYSCIEIGNDGQQVKCVRTLNLQDQEAPSARADQSMPIEAGIYYYEVTVMSKGKDGMIGIGFSSNKVSLERLPGWDPESWAYHGDDGKTFAQTIVGKAYGPTFTSDDTIGCGVDFMDGTAFYTKNGNFLGTAFRDLRDTALYPSVGMKRPHAHLVANFGQRPFIFDIDTYVERKREVLRAEIRKTNTSSLHPSLQGEDLTKALVAQYLSHDGYVETAQAFADEVQQDSKVLTGSSKSSIDDFLTVESDRDAASRQQIRTAILEGDIDKTLHFTNTLFPTVLRNDPEINFRLRCRKFIEMMRESAEVLDTIPSPSKLTQAANGHSDISAMDVDEPPAQDAFDKMDTSEVTDGSPDTQRDMNHILNYGQELNAQFQDFPDLDLKKLFDATMKELFGMLAYKDPRKSPAARYLETSERVKLAEGLNSAILVSLGKSSSTALERMYKQTVIFTDMISEDGGVGCLINVRNILKQRRANSANQKKIL